MSRSTGGTCSGACPGPFEAGEAFVDEATEAVEEWLSRHRPLSRAEFDDLRARFARGPGQPAVYRGEYGGRRGEWKNVHVRDVDAGELGQWTATADVALVDLDETVAFADLHGVPIAGEAGVVPIVVATAGPHEEARRRTHVHYHALERVRERLGGSGRIMTDGGEVLPEDQCARGDCEREAVGSEAWSLCERHQAELGSDEGVTEPNRNDTTESVRHTSDSKSQNTNTPDGDGVDRADNGAGDVTTGDKVRERRFDTRPESAGPVSSIPAPLDDLGQVIVPIDPGEKGTRRPRTDDHLFTPDDPVIEAYLEAGHNYGVACQGDLAVLDADEPEALAELIDALPETAAQVSGSRSSKHYFLQVPGLDEDIPLDDPETGENLGHIKAASQSYVVGPGSRHPSGNRYGPLRGDRIATVDEADLREFIDPYRPDVDGAAATTSPTPRAGGTSRGDTPIDIGDVLTGYTEGVRTEHPFHGSDTGANFLIDEGGETWRCWRHNCTGNALHLAGMEQGIIECGEWDGTGLDTETWREIFTAAREAGYDLPEFDSAEGGGVDPVSTLPLERLAALDRDDRRRSARKRGLEWPTTDEARERLRNRILQAVRHGEDVVIDAPTALGKSHTVATEPWLRRADVTDEQPVIQFSETCEARDQAATTTRQHGSTARVLKGRKERCPVAAGDHDPADEDEEAPDVVVTIDGRPASAWFDTVCDGRGVPFSVAHQYLGTHNDQDVDLPCCAGEGEECSGMTQWDGVPRTDDGDPGADVIHATHQFAHVPSLTYRCNVVFDERPSFTADISTDRVQRAVTAYLKEIGAPVSTWETFVGLALHDGYRGDAAAEHDATREAIQKRPDREWYLEAADAHTLAPALARAVWYALGDDVDANGRRSAVVPHDPPRLDGSARDDDGWNRSWVTVVIDADNRIRTVRAAPDLSQARCVIGLDAHPTAPLWQRNTRPEIQVDPLLDAAERRLWRRFERGLTVIQVGEHTRPAGKNGQWLVDDGAGRATRAVLEQLREQYGPRFDSVITAKKAKVATERLMREVGIDEPDTMHFGEEKSRNDFGGKDVGLVNGCIDPGDDYVLDLLAELELDAEPEREDGERAHGRGFTGPDADTARALLGSVRENHVAQSAGRYARDADDPHNEAVVFVRTDASPPGFVDLQVPGVEWAATDTQRDVIEALRERERATARELADAVGCSKKHVADTLDRLVDHDGDPVVDVRPGEGAYGADVYEDAAGGSVSGVVDLGSVDLSAEKIANDPVWGLYTWSFAIRDVNRGGRPVTVGGAGGEATAPVADPIDGHPDPGGDASR